MVFCLIDEHISAHIYIARRRDDRLVYRWFRGFFSWFLYSWFRVTTYYMFSASSQLETAGRCPTDLKGTAIHAHMDVSTR